VGGQRIGFARKDWKVGGQLPALLNRFRPQARSQRGDKGGIAPPPSDKVTFAAYVEIAPIR